MTDKPIWEELAEIGESAPEGTWGKRMDISEIKIGIDKANKEMWEAFNARRYGKAWRLAKEISVAANEAMKAIDDIPIPVGEFDATLAEIEAAHGYRPAPRDQEQ